MEGCDPKMMAIKMLVLGLILILVPFLQPTWNMWVVLGVLAVLKGLMMFMKPAKKKGKK